MGCVLRLQIFFELAIALGAFAMVVFTVVQLFGSEEEEEEKEPLLLEPLIAAYCGLCDVVIVFYMLGFSGADSSAETEA